MKEQISGAIVWRGEELAHHPDLRQELSPAELTELRSVAASSTEATLPNDSPAVLPHLASRGATLRQQLEDGPGVIRLRGLPIDAFDEQQLARVLLVFAQSIGTPVSQSVDGERLFRVADAGLGAQDARARGPNSRNALTFHSDRSDVIGFLCIRPAERGGESIVVSAAAIHNEIARSRPDLLELLYQPFYWDRHNVDTSNENPWYRMPIFAQIDDRFAITLMQVLIDRAHRRADLPPLTDPQHEALALIQKLAAEPSFQLRFRQEPGEILLLNNYVTLHSRTEFSDPPGAAGRLLLRVWISVPNSRPLPRSWAAHYGGFEAGALRGGIRQKDPSQKTAND